MNSVLEALFWLPHGNRSTLTCDKNPVTPCTPRKTCSAFKKYLGLDGTSTRPKKARHGNVRNRENYGEGEIKDL